MNTATEREAAKAIKKAIAALTFCPLHYSASDLLPAMVIRDIGEAVTLLEHALAAIDPRYKPSEKVVPLRSSVRNGFADGPPTPDDGAA